MGGGGGGMSAPPPSDELGLPSDSDDSDEGSDSEDERAELVENFDEAQKWRFGRNCSFLSSLRRSTARLRYASARWYIPAPPSPSSPPS